jgi:hypothetical protein
MSLPERGWTGYGAQGHPYAPTAGDRCAEYRLADLHLTRAHRGPALCAEFPVRRREALAREVWCALAYIALESEA